MDITSVLSSFLREDAADNDITTRALFENRQASARIEAREDIIISGVEECVALFEMIGVKTEICIADGCPAAAYDVIMRLSGPLYSLLSGERTALNLLGRMSGIATATFRAARLVTVVNNHVKIAGTRKTAPGLRFFDKKAITAGGGLPHRFDLSDAFLIKDTHRTLLSVDEAVMCCRQYDAEKTVECEVESVDDAVRAARAGADTIMFDNMTPDDIRRAVSALEAAGLRSHVTLELSGGMRPETFLEFAGLDVDVISMGSLTHSVRCADVSLEIEPELPCPLPL